MRIRIDIDTDRPETYDELVADLENLIASHDEHGPRATWVQISESVYEGMAPRRGWIGESDDDGCDCGDMACEHPDHREVTPA
jgi:hypothetical protein